MGGRTNEQTGFDEEEVGVRGGERGKVVDPVDRYMVQYLPTPDEVLLSGPGSR